MTDTTDLRGTRVLVTDAEIRLALHVIRSLGRAGCEVTALSAARDPAHVLGFSSRFTAKRHVVEPGDARHLVDAIEALAGTHDVLVPVSAGSLMTVARHAERVSARIRCYLPDLQTMEIATSKAATTRLAEEIGIPVPRTFQGLEPGEVERWQRGSGLAFPLVVKFSDDRRESLWSPGDRYRIVRGVADLVREYARMHAVAPYPLIQEYVEGQGHGFFALTSPEGEPLVRFCHRRLREYPVSGGPSTLCESVYDPVLVEQGSALLRRLRFRGVAMVEFKRERRTGEQKFLEINPRFWGSLPLALQCGVDFPADLVRLALGRPLASTGAYPEHRRMRFLFSDVRAVMAGCRAKHAPATIVRYLGELLDPSIRDGFIDWDDPKPTWTYIRNRIRSSG